MGDCKTSCSALRQGMSAFFNMPEVEKLLEDKGLAHAEISALRELVQLEWVHFDTVQGMSGRAACQDDAVGFFVHHVAQYLSFPRESIMGVRDDVVAADAAGRNVIREKYARMMEMTDPVAFARDWSGRLEAPSPVKRCVLNEIESALRSMLDTAQGELPATAQHVRGSITQPKLISSIGYYVCEIQSYSLSTLKCLRDGLRHQLGNHVNPVLDTYVNAVFIQRVLEA